MTQNWLFAVAFASLLTAGAAPAQQRERPPGGAASPPNGTAQQDAQARIQLPAGANLVSSIEVDRIHIFPEQQSGKGKMPAETTASVRANDRIYQTSQSYDDVVKFFDQNAAKNGNKVLSRDKTQTATAWSIELPKGKVANIVVRNTQPTTVEIVSATDVVAEIQTGGGAPGQ